MEIKEKAWKVGKNPTSWQLYENEAFEDDYFEIIYAETRNKARNQYLRFNDIDYANIKAIRSKPDDIILVNGVETTRERYSFRESEIKRIDKRKKEILKYPENEMLYIQNGYVGNYIIWWALNSVGYTSDFSRAQKYSRQEILDHYAVLESEHRIWAASHVDNSLKKTVIDSQYLDYKFKH